MHLHTTVILQELWCHSWSFPDENSAQSPSAFRNGREPCGWHVVTRTCQLLPVVQFWHMSHSSQFCKHPMIAAGLTDGDQCLLGFGRALKNLMQPSNNKVKLSECYLRPRPQLDSVRATHGQHRKKTKIMIQCRLQPPTAPSMC